MQAAFDVWWDETVPLMVNEDVAYSPVHPQVVRYEEQLKARGIPKWTPDPEAL